MNDVNQKFSEELREAHKHVKLILSLTSIREMEIKQQSYFMSYPLDSHFEEVTIQELASMWNN